MTKENRVKFRGFGSMTPERHREVASAGGKMAQAGGRAHRWTPEEAKEAGRKGGRASQKKEQASVA